jgi:hypothetical protein
LRSAAVPEGTTNQGCTATSVQKWTPLKKLSIKLATRISPFTVPPIFSYKLYSMATPRHPKPLLLENHVCIIAFTPNLQRIFFYSIIDFLYYSFTTKLILSLILIKGPYPSSKASHLCRKSSSALWLLWRANSYMIATWISTSSKRLTIFG